MSISWSIQTYETLSSTQDYVRQAAAAGAAQGLVVHAQTQTAGRGRHGRSWVSQEGNLFLSFLLRPDMRAERAGELSLLAAVALAKTIQGSLSDPELLILKWPNDLLLDGHKCAGILVETNINKAGRIAWAVIGIGVNIISAPEGLGKALNDYGVKPLNSNDFRDHFLKTMQAWYERWTNEGFEPIKEAWIEGAHKVGAPVSVKMTDRILSGHFAGLDERGGLLLDTAEGLKTVTAGDVFLEE